MCGSAVPRRGAIPPRWQRAKLIRANLYERPTAKDKLAIQISNDTVAVHVVELSVTGTKTGGGTLPPWDLERGARHHIAAS